ncbi:glycoside hydrolase family 2 protein [Kribbella sp. NBC_00482]|uniref:glycoside hydrolase family 2 protein n=1 Tax=Kribbella sp. NBC_00482 TaxID=2975968 RepID=UPI002E16EE98
MTIEYLHEGWTLSLVDGPDDVPIEVRNARVPATVPGCVHTDLLAAGLIPDPYLDDNEHRLHWIGWSDWEYSTEFPADVSSPLGRAIAAGERVDVAFDGLDTIATVAVNGVEVGRTVNMHRRYRFDITSLLRDGANTLSVRFSSAERYALAEQERLGGPYPCAEGRPYSYIRKMACNFKWDWGPDLLTAGIWRAASLQTWSGARIAEVRPLVTVENLDDVGGAAVGKVVAHVDIERQTGSEGALVVTAEVAGVTSTVTVGATETSASVELTVDSPELWWPHGYGEQPLYELTVSLEPAGLRGAYDSWHRRIGFRSLRLDTAPDAAGAPFTFVVNGRPVFAKGVNWIPDDCFPSRIDHARYLERLTQARQANVNLVRVWGGGIFESDDFYDVCDELGILAWQDFLFACAAYNEETLTPEVDAEARDNIARLSPHPSLVLWNGNNETIWGWVDGDWSAVGDRSWGEGFYLELLPRIAAELDPTRPYWGGSPYSGSMDLHPNDERYGLTHVWDVWNDVDYPVYREHRPRFVSEFGFQGPPTMATLSRAIDVADPAALRNRQRAQNGERKLSTGLSAHFRPPDDLDDWHFLAQVNQARALRLGIEHFRSLRPHCMGTIWWQLNDCWPVNSWACIDGDGQRKPAWYALQAAYAPRLLTIQPATTGLRVVAVNETDESWSGELVVERLRFDGDILATTRTGINCNAYETVEASVADFVASPIDPTSELLRARLGDSEATWFYARDFELTYPKAKYEVEVTSGSVEVTARTLLRDVCLFVDRLSPNAFVDRALVTLLPGEQVRFGITCDDRLPAEQLVRAPVLRCVND